MDQHMGDDDPQPTDQNDGQLPGRDDAQLPRHNEAEYLDPTLRQSNFVTTANLLGTPGGAGFQIDNNTTWASASLRDEYDLAYDDHDARLPQEQFDPTYHGGPVLNYHQTQEWYPNNPPNSWSMPPTVPQPFLENNSYQAVNQQQAQYLGAHPQGYTGGYNQVPPTQGNTIYPASGQQQTQLPGGYYSGYSGSDHQAPLTSNYNYDHLGRSDLDRYNNPFQQEAYPGHRPTFTTPRTPAANGLFSAAAYDHQYDLASTGSAPTELASTQPASTAPASTESASIEPASEKTTKKSRQRKRKRPDNQQEDDEEEDEQKDATKKSKGDTSIETKKRKKQDEEDRRALSRMRDEVASRAFDMASQHFPDAAARAAFQEQWDTVMELNREIDNNTELYLPWYSTRASLRKTDRAVPERKKED